MKNIILIFFLTCFGFTSNAQITKAEIVATGLTCSMCSNAINKQLKKLPEIEKVDVDLNSNTFTIYIKKGNTISPRILKESIQKAGFFVGSMIVTLDLDNPKIAGNPNFIFMDTKSQKGETRFKILDKGYLVMKDFKKLSKLYANSPTYNIENEDNYHLKNL